MMTGYGIELIMDLHGCDVAQFNRPRLTLFFRELCERIGMTPEALYWWDDVGVAPQDRQTDPRTKGTSAVQFILTSSIVVHTLEIPRSVYINVFSCDDFDTEKAATFMLDFFSADTWKTTVLERT